MPDEDAPAREGPIVLMDVGDNIGGGSSADSTHILGQVVERGISGFLQTLYDPESVDACVAAGVGGTVTLDVGGKTDDMHGSPVRVTGTVRSITDGQYEELVAWRVPVLRLWSERAFGYGWWSDVGADVSAGG